MDHSQDSVLSALKTALDAAPQDTNLILHIAQHLSNKQDHALALEYFQKILALSPIHKEALQGASEAATKVNRQDLAKDYVDLLSKVYPAEASQTPTSMGAEESPQRVRGAKLRLVKNDEETTESFVEAEDSQVYLKDVGGMEEVKRRLNLSFLAPLQNPELMAAYGKSVSGGLLLYGPPGCGKTFIAKALAGELGAKFISVGLTDILDMYVGQSEMKLHELFENARRNTPAVLFFDELDAIGQKRSQLKNSGMRSLVNQLLLEMDSGDKANENLFILGATNHPWDVDNALRRPGRFDRIVPVFPPDQEAREAILASNLANKPTEEIDLNQLASRTQGFSGADLKHLCDSAVEYAMEASMETGNLQKITSENLQRTLADIKPSTHAWFDTAKNYAMFANEHGQYDDLLEYIREQNL